MYVRRRSQRRDGFKRMESNHTPITSPAPTAACVRFLRQRGVPLPAITAHSGVFQRETDRESEGLLGTISMTGVQGVAPERCPPSPSFNPGNFLP